MKCPFCGAGIRATVTRHVKSNNGILRYRECLGEEPHRFKTIEVQTTETFSTYYSSGRNETEHKRAWRKRNPEKNKEQCKRARIRADARKEAAERGVPPEVVYREWDVLSRREIENGF